MDIRGQKIITVDYPTGKAEHIPLAQGIGCLALPERSAYVASKGAIRSMTKAPALDFGEYGIRVNCIAPVLSGPPVTTA